MRTQLRGKDGAGLRLPYWFGMFLGFAADAISYLTRKNLPISSIRVKKFASSTQFLSSKGSLDNFIAPFQLSDMQQHFKVNLSHQIQIERFFTANDE